MWGQSNVGNPRRAFFRCVTARLPSVRPWKGALERDDESALGVLRRLHAIEQHGLDRVLDRLGAGIDDEVARRAGGAIWLKAALRRSDSIV
jgi:hypothetical protein